MSKPLTMTVEKEREYRACCTSGGTEVDPVFAELDATRAALAAAEAREQEAFAAGVQQGLFTRDEAAAKVLADEKASRIGWAESAERWRNHYYETLALLADERRHADHQNASLECSLECVCDSMCPTTWPTGEARPHHAMCVAVRATLAAHAARRAAAATLSDAGASSEVANG